MASKRRLLVENERLRAEVSYLRGRVEVLQGAPADIVAHIRGLVTDTLGAVLPSGPVVANPGPMFEDAGASVPFDWTDHLAPRAMNADELADMEADLNDRLVIADELDRDP